MWVVGFRFALLLSIDLIASDLTSIPVIHNVSFLFANGQQTSMAGTCLECLCAMLHNSTSISFVNCFPANDTCELFANASGVGPFSVVPSAESSFYFLTLPLYDNPSTISSTQQSNTTAAAVSEYVPKIIEWLLDGDLGDVYGVYNGAIIDANRTEWISPGYNGRGSAVYFQGDMYALVNRTLNLTMISFTFTAWVWIPYNTSASSNAFFVLIGHCESTAQDKCLHLVIKDGRLFLGFYSDDLIGNIRLQQNRWYHVAYVYDRSGSQQRVYVDGKLDKTRTPTGPYIGNANRIILGSVRQFGSKNFLNGYVDKLTFVSRAKQTDELLDEATLVAYYPFDSSYLDKGPNQINNVTTVATLFDPAGQLQQALLIDDPTAAYFQASGFYYLGQINYSFSFSLWLYTAANNGTIVQVSADNDWCLPIIGFDRAQHLTIQTIGHSGVYSVSFASSSLALQQWAHVTMTYSTMQGIRLFINGTLVNGTNSSTAYVASGTFSTITVGAYVQSNGCLLNQTVIVPSQFRGKVDELKIFSRELTNSEVQQLAMI